MAEVTQVVQEMTFSEREVRVLGQFLEAWGVKEQVFNIHEQDYVKNFKPGVNQIRLSKSEFATFAHKLQQIVGGG